MDLLIPSSPWVTISFSASWFIGELDSGPVLQGANQALAPPRVQGSQGFWGLSCNRLSLKLLVNAMYFTGY